MARYGIVIFEHRRNDCKRQVYVVLLTVFNQICKLVLPLVFMINVQYVFGFPNFC